MQQESGALMKLSKICHLVENTWKMNTNNEVNDF